MALPDLRELLYQKKQFDQYVSRLKDLEESIKNSNGIEVLLLLSIEE